MPHTTAGGNLGMCKGFIFIRRVYLRWLDNLHDFLFAENVKPTDMYFYIRINKENIHIKNHKENTSLASPQSP